MSMQNVEKVTVTYVEFLFPGSFVSESSCKEVSNRDKPKRIPKGAFAYSFYDREKTIVGEEEFWGDRKNRSGTFYPEAEIFNLKQIKENFPDSTILISNMECNKWKHIVKTRRGNFQPFEKEDRVV